MLIKRIAHISEYVYLWASICCRIRVCTLLLTNSHRRRMETEEKSKVVASVWGADFIQFLAALAVLPRWIWKKRISSTFAFKSTKAKQRARQGIECILPPKQTWRPLPYLLSPSFFYCMQTEYILPVECVVETVNFRISPYCGRCLWTFEY